MADRKTQHFLPRFYLKNFASDSEGRQIRLYRVAAKAHVPVAAIRSQCAAPYFYGRDGRLEEALGEFESDVARVVKRMITDEAVPEPYSSEEATVLKFALLQRERTPRAAAHVNAEMTSMYQAVIKSFPDEKHRRAAKHVRVTHEHAWAFGVQRAFRHAATLADLRMVLLKNDTECEFVTSDAAVVFHNHWARKATGVGNIGLTCCGLQVVIPLSPRYAAMLFDSDVYAVVNDRKACDVVSVQSELDVQRLNALQAAWCHEVMFYRSEAMAARIDELPHGARRSPEEYTKVFRAKEQDGSSVLIITAHEGARVDLSLECLRVRDGAALVPWKKRVQQWLS